MKSNVAFGEKGKHMKNKHVVNFKLITPKQDKLRYLTYNYGLGLMLVSGGLQITATIIYPSYAFFYMLLWGLGHVIYFTFDYYRYEILKDSDYSVIGKIPFSNDTLKINNQKSNLKDNLIILNRYYIRGKREYKGQNRNNGFSEVKINGSVHQFLIENQNQYLKLIRLLKYWESKRLNIFELPSGDHFYYFFIAKEPVMNWKKKEELKERYLITQIL